MGNPINAVLLPADIQRLLPAGVKVFSFDGEVLYKYTNTKAMNQHRTFSLRPVRENAQMYERRWMIDSMQDTHLAIENLHGHIATVYYFYLPNKETARTGKYDVRAFAAMSHSTQQWIWITGPGPAAEVLEGRPNLLDAGDFTKLAKLAFLPGGRNKRNDQLRQLESTIEEVALYLRDEVKRQQKGSASDGRL
jgi:hypothetical protein